MTRPKSADCQGQDKASDQRGSRGFGIREKIQRKLRIIPEWAQMATGLRPPEMSKDLRQAISRFVRDENFTEWLQKPNVLMKNRTPADLLKCNREDLIWSAIGVARKCEP